MTAQTHAMETGWILTATGRRFYPSAPNREQIALFDIAHALSMQCRWNGHTRVFFSVAQHCVLASDICVAYPAEALMHDAAEAFVSDVPKPVKRQFPDFEVYEDQLLKQIFGHLGLVYPLPMLVKLTDELLLRWEARDLFDEDRCEELFGPRAKESIRQLPFLYPWSAAEAERRFLARATQVLMPRVSR